MARLSSAPALAALALALLTTLACAAPDGLGNEVFAMPAGGPKIVFIGGSPNVKLYPNSSSTEFLLLKFGAVAEATQDGTDIRAHTIPSLAALKPSVTTGEVSRVEWWWIALPAGGRARGGERESQGSQKQRGVGASCGDTPPAAPLAPRAPRNASCAHVSKRDRRARAARSPCYMRTHPPPPP